MFLIQMVFDYGYPSYLDGRPETKATEQTSTYVTKLPGEERS